MRGIKILGTGVYTPDVKVTNDDLSKIMETDNEWIVSRTGISSRNYSKDKSNHYMATEASKEAMKNAGVTAEDIDLIIASTCSAEYFYPNLASLIQGGIGAVNAAVVEVNTACTGFISAVDIASRYLQDDDYKTVLVVASERLAPHVDFEDRASCILFGDGAGAAVITKSDKPMYSYSAARLTASRRFTATRTSVTTAPMLMKRMKPHPWRHSIQKRRCSTSRWTVRAFISSLLTLWRQRLKRLLQRQVLPRMTSTL